METLGSIFTDTSRLHYRYHHTVFESFTKAEKDSLQEMLMRIQNQLLQEIDVENHH